MGGYTEFISCDFLKYSKGVKKYVGEKYVEKSEHMTHAHRNNENKRQTVYICIMNIWLMVNKDKFC